MIKFTIIKITKMIKMNKMINNLISGRETQLRSPFYSPLNSMWQVWEGVTLKNFKKENHDDDDGDNDKRVITSGYDLIISTEHA